MHDNERRPVGEKFPCASLGEALPHLRRPPAPAAVRFKIHNAAEQAAQVAAYVDARLVFDRLDHVCGERWWDAFEQLPKALIPAPVDRTGELKEPPPLYVRCRLTLYEVTREDVGEGQDPKAAVSDAVKRAAVHFGVGRVLYAMRLPWLSEGDGNGELRRNGRRELILDRRTEAWCREMYERWLTEGEGKRFGQPLDHGDPHAPGVDQGRPEPASAGDRAAGSQPETSPVAPAGHLRDVAEGRSDNATTTARNNPPAAQRDDAQAA